MVVVTGSQGEKWTIYTKKKENEYRPKESKRKIIRHSSIIVSKKGNNETTEKKRLPKGSMCACVRVCACAWVPVNYSFYSDNRPDSLISY